ncbi:MAG: hypothetical protein KAI66_14170 [Lentisphaeria bacterium]|nr:hypothetical protein [Lentisphaeria bacterium]
MKANPKNIRTRNRMSPGRLSLAGFLGDDPRTLDDIVEADLATLEAEGVSCEQIADFLDHLHEAADSALEAPTSTCSGKATVQLTETMGRIPCPFACGVRAHKAVIQVTIDGETLQLTPLQIHLIREHSFFQGRGSVFRLEPAHLAQLCRLCPLGD